MKHLKTINQRGQEFISVVLSIWVADAMVKQISFLSGLNNLWGMILVAGLLYSVADYVIEIVTPGKKS